MSNSSVNNPNTLKGPVDAQAQQGPILDQLMATVCRGRSSFEERYTAIQQMRLAWKSLQQGNASSTDYAYVFSYVAYSFYVDERFEPVVYQLLPDELRKWAHFGQRVHSGAGREMPRVMHGGVRDPFCELDTDLLRNGDPAANLQALCLFLRELKFSSPDETLSDNTWLLAMGDYSVKVGYCDEVPSSLFTLMRAWFPQYESYLKHCAGLSLGFDDVLAHLPMMSNQPSTTPPFDVSQ